jgi:hypothetical protein
VTRRKTTRAAFPQPGGLFAGVAGVGFEPTQAEPTVLQNAPACTSIYHLTCANAIELFRHRCTEIYCFDASSDSETFAASLGQSITLAAAELGVIVEPDHPELADPRDGGKDTEAGDRARRPP